MQDLNWFEKIPVNKLKLKENRQDEFQEYESGPVNFMKYTEEASRWAKEVAAKMETKRQDCAFRALRSVLHVIRDRSTPQEISQLSAQLPVMIRGFFYEGYRYRSKPEKFHVDELLSRIEEGMTPGCNIDPRLVFHSVLAVLNDHVSEGEMKDIFRIMPEDIRDMWKETEN